MRADAHPDGAAAVRDRRTRNPRGEGERLRAALMEAAGELLIENGSAERLSIRSITARAGVSPTALYLHFSDKDELVAAVCDEAFEELGSYLRSASASQKDARAQLRAMGEAYVSFAQERPGLYRILFATRMPGGGRPDHLDAPEEDPGMQAFGELVRVVGECLAGGTDPRPVALQVWTALHGYVTLRQAMPRFDWPTPEEFLDQLYLAQVGA